jgi:hypothetical protein
MSDPVINQVCADRAKLLCSLPQWMQVGAGVSNWENPAKDNTTTSKDLSLLRC